MHKTIVGFLIIFIFQSVLFAQDSTRVTIKVYTRLPDDSSAVFITGNNPVTGNWNPSFFKMKKVNDTTWSSEFYFDRQTNFEYKFTLGSWEREALNDDKTIPSNYKLKITTDTTLEYFVNYWSDGQRRIPGGQITGAVNYHNNLGGKEILPRNIIVWLPPGYESDNNKRYPVLYMQDGQNIIDPQTSSFGNDWQLDENADTLIRKGYIEPIIIAGIYNTNLRGSEYGINDTADLYKKFIVEELKPFIDSNYRTRKEKENTAVCGSSLGGLISFELAWEYPDVFSKAGCVSPAFNIDRYNYVSIAGKYSGYKKPLQIYIDNGGKGIDSLLQPGVDEMISVLESKGFEKGKDLFYEFYPDAAHSERDWAARVWRILIYFFGTEKGKRLL